MGVSGLWQLLAPCGRRTAVESLAHKRLAVDASIWLIQFMKAMRDERTGEMVHNAPLLGLFRRLCKLLALRIFPVLVFDGATPSLKLRTIARRREFRNRQESSMRRTAEKILLNRMNGRHLLYGATDATNVDGRGGGDAFEVQFTADDAAADGLWSAAGPAAAPVSEHGEEAAAGADVDRRAL